MEKEKSENTSKEEIIKSLSQFVLRVAKGQASPDETMVLPEIAKIVISYHCSPFSRFPDTK